MFRWFRARKVAKKLGLQDEGDPNCHDEFMIAWCRNCIKVGRKGRSKRTNNTYYFCLSCEKILHLIDKGEPGGHPSNRSTTKTAISIVLGLLTFLIFAQSAEAQSPVDRLTNGHLNLIERQGNKLQFLLDRMRYRRESGYYLGNRPYFDNGGFIFGNNYNYFGGRRYYRDDYSGYGYPNYGYGYRNGNFSIGRSSRYAIIGGLLGGGISGSRGALIGAGAGLLIGELEKRSERRRYKPVQTYVPTFQGRCFYNQTRYYIDIYPIGGRRITQLAPGQLWPIIDSPTDYHTSARFDDGTWFPITLRVVPCSN